ncbi:hypothetical protein MFLAVUS_003740 [Mucor flavus]|uniref:Uncharacterized protein n=1 Tax=Mucor flavus TaxID=439312 RepID=A0ABP9YTY0_9FUNG
MLLLLINVLSRSDFQQEDLSAGTITDDKISYDTILYDNQFTFEARDDEVDVEPEVKEEEDEPVPRIVDIQPQTEVIQAVLMDLAIDALYLWMTDYQLADAFPVFTEEYKRLHDKVSHQKMPLTCVRTLERCSSCTTGMRCTLVTSIRR